MLTVFVTYHYFLGLRTLTVIQNAVKNIKKNKGITIDIDNIDMNDKAVLESLGTGHTEGVFQLESAGMKNFMKELKPENLEDIIAGISLYRPGPMDFIPKYLKGKNDKASITYDCPQLEPILAPTYGCIVYQEQVMQIVRDLAGYTLGRSDLVRRAMSKKKGSVMEKERKNFIYGNQEEGVKGCIANGIPEKVAQTIYNEMIDFAKYAFNKSHAACYAVVSYETAYLKHYYPVEFMAALMTSVIDNLSKVSEYIQVCRQMGINILPPDINSGESGFSVSGNHIRYGLSALKSVGKSVIDSITAERQENGPFTSLKDFISRLSGKEANKRTIESFIKSGALDELPGTRKQKMQVYALIMDQVSKEKKSSMTGQMTLFDLVGEDNKSEFDITFPDVGEFPKSELLLMEKEILGIYVSGHPLMEEEGVMKKNVTATSIQFVVDEDTGLAEVTDGSIVTIGGIVADKTVKTTKNNQMMAFLTLEDLVGTVEVILFPKDYEKYKPFLEEDKKLLIRGRVSLGEEAKGKLICEKIMPFENVPKDIWIQFDSIESYQRQEMELKRLIEPWEGDNSIVIFLKHSRQYKKMPKNWNIAGTPENLEILFAKYGKNNVRVVEKAIENWDKMH